MEILAKFGSALSGFWWSLDDHERKMLIISGAWLVAVAWKLATQESQRERELDRIADRVAERLSNG